mmetsp:Transcript_17601/g.58005  ORF Transcript_17601/g.58005 Transcript_17601/m.58005 type:complete len:582 (-) Transcript_17601:328-2073(-)
MQVLGDVWRTIFSSDLRGEYVSSAPASVHGSPSIASPDKAPPLSWNNSLHEMMSTVIPLSPPYCDAREVEEGRSRSRERLLKPARLTCAICGGFLKGGNIPVFDVCTSCSLNASHRHSTQVSPPLTERRSRPPSTSVAPRFWRATGPVSECIRACLAGHGYTAGSSAQEWLVAWGSSLSSEEISRLKPSQKHNHLPGWDSLNNKATLGEVARTHSSRGSSLADNVPLTFVLPQHADELLAHHRRGGGPYIVKPVGGTRGKGIRLMTEVSDAFLKERRRLVVQQYIMNPHLLQGRKYDLRLYVAVTSSDPLRLYIHEQGYGRFCSEEYDLSRPQDLFRHITNSNFQKFHELYALSGSSSRTRPAGNKWHIDIIRREWEREGNRGVWERIKTAITKVFIMFKEEAISASRGVAASQSSCFSLFGIDVLLDDQLKPWLLELNSLPSTGTSSPLDIEVKTSVINDLLHLLGLSQEDPEHVKLQVCRLLSSKLDSKWTKEVGSKRSPPLPPPPTPEVIRRRLVRGGWKQVNPREIEVVQEYEEEMARRRGWICCFPSHRMGQYAIDLGRPGGDAVLAAYVAGAARG